MSTSIDNRVVQMEFDNAQFESGIAKSLQTLERLDNALNDLENTGGFKGLSSSISSIGDELSDTFSFRGVAALETFRTIADDVIGYVKNLFVGLKNTYMPVDFIDKVITGGQNRARNIEDAKFRLSGLGFAYEDLADDINYAVKGTAYGLDSAAKAASQLAASAVKFGDAFGETGNSPMAKALRGISGVAAMTNSSYDEIAHIFTTIASNNKMMTKETRMFAYRGLNITSTLADVFNSINGYTDKFNQYNFSENVIAQIKEITDGMAVAEADFEEFRKKGMITADLFFEAMDAAFGEHATDANKTYAGSLANIGAALSRLGASYYQGHMDNMIGVFNALQKAVDKVHEKLKPTIAKFLEFEKVFTVGLSDFFNSDRYVGFDPFENILFNLTNVITMVKQAFADAFPDFTVDAFAELVSSINEFIAGLIIPRESLTKFRDALTGLLDIFGMISDAIGTVMHILSPWINVLNMIGALVSEVFASMGNAIHEFRGEISDNEEIEGFVDGLYLISDVLANIVVDAIAWTIAIIRTFGDAIETASRLITMVGAVALIGLGVAFESLSEPVQTAILLIINGFEKIWNYIVVLKDSVISAFGKNGIKGALDVLVFGLKLIPGVLRAAFGPLFTLLTSGIMTLFAPAITFVTDLWDKLVEFKDGFVDALPNAFKNIGERISGFGDTIRNTFSPLGSVLNSTFLEPFRNLFSEGGTISGFIEDFKTRIIALPGQIILAFQLIGSTIQEYFASKIAIASAVFDEFKAAFNEGGFAGVFDLLKQKFVDFGESIRETFVTLKDTTIPYLLESIGNGINSLSQKFPLFGSLINYLKLVKDNIVKFLRGLWESFTGPNGITTLPRKLYEAGRDAIGGLVKGFLDNSIIGSLYAAISALVGSKESGTGIIGFFARLVGWHSPWTVFIEAAKDGLRALAIGFMDSTLVKAILGVLELLKDAIIGALEPAMPVFKAFGETLRKYLAPSNIWNGIKMGAKFIGELAGQIAYLVTTVGSGIITRLSKLPTIIGNLFSGLSDFDLGEFAKKLGKPFEVLYNGLLKIWGFVKGIVGIIGEMGEGKFGPALQQALGITMLIAIPQLIIGFARAIDTAKKGLGIAQGAIKGLLKAVNGVVGFFTNIGKTFAIAIKLGEIRKLLVSAGIVIGLVGLLVYQFAKLDDKEFGRALVVAEKLFGFVLTVSGLMVFLVLVSQSSGFTSINSAKAGISKGATAIVQVAGMLIGMAVAMYGMAKAFEILKNLNLDWDTLAVPLVTLGLMMGTLVAAIGAISKVAPKFSIGLVSLIAFTVIMYEMVNVFKELVGITAVFHGTGNNQAIYDAVIALVAIFGALAVLEGAAGVMGVSGGIGLLAAMYALKMLDEVFGVLINSENLNFVNIKSHLEQLASALAVLIAFFITTRFAGKNALGAGIAVLTISYSLTVIVDTLAKLGDSLKNLSASQIGWMVGVLTAVFIGLGGILMVSQDINFKSILGIVAATGAIISLILVVTLLTSLMTLAAHLDPDALIIAQQTMVMLGLTVGAMIASTKAAEKVKPLVLVGIIGAIISVAASLALLPIIAGDVEKIRSVAWSLGGVIVAIGVMAGFASKLKWSAFFSLLGVSVVVVAVAASLAGLAYFDKDGSVMHAAQALAGVLLVITVITSHIGKIKLSEWISLVTITGVMVVAAGALALLATFDFENNILHAAVGLSAVLLIMVAITNYIGAINFSKWVNLVTITAAMVAVGLTLSVLAQNDWMSILVAAGSIAGVFAIVALASRYLMKLNVQSFLSLLAITAAISISALALSQLAQYDWQNILAAAGAIAGVMAIMGIVMGLLAGIGTATGGGFTIALIGVAAAFLIFSGAVWVFADAAQKFVEAAMLVESGAVSLETVSELIKTIFSSIAEGLITGFVQGILNGAELIWQALTDLGQKIWEKIQNLFPEGFDLIGTVKDFFQPVIDFFIGTGEGTLLGSVDSLKLAISEKLREMIPADFDLLGTIKGLFQPVIEFFVGSGEGTLLGAIESIKNSMQEFFGNLFPADFDLLTTIQTFFQPLIDFFTSETGLVATLTQAGSDMIQGLVSSIINFAFPDIPGLIREKIFGSGENSLDNLEAEGKKRGNNFLSGLIAGIKDKGLLAMLGEGAAAAGNWALGWFDKTVGNNSPWETMIERGKNALLGLAKGMDDPAAKAALEQVANSIGNLAVDGISDTFLEGMANLNVVADSEIGNLLSKVKNAKAQIKEQGLFNYIGTQVKEKLNFGGMLDDFKSKMDEIGSTSNLLGGGGGGGGGGLSGAAGKAAKSTKELAEEAKNHEKAVKYQNAAAEEFIRVYGDVFTSLDETTDVTEIAKSAIEDLARTFGLTEDDVADTEADIEELFLNMYNTIHDSVEGSMKLFERFSSEASVAPETMLRNMRSNFTGIEEWSEEVQMLAAKGFSKGFVEELVKEGPASQAKVRTFLKMTFGQMMEANDLYAKKSEATAQATVKAITAMAFAGKTQDELIRLANDSTGSMESKAAKAALEAANHMQKVMVTYRELRDTIEQTVESQIDLFSEFDMKTETSAEKMLENMQSQIRGTTDWANGLEVLAERGIDDGLLAKLAELGPKGYDQVNAFVQMTAEQLQQANDYYQQSLVLPSKVSTQVSTSYLNTGISVAESMIGGVTQGTAQQQEEVHLAIAKVAQNAADSTCSDITNGVVDVQSVGMTMDEMIATGEIANVDETVTPASKEIVEIGAAAAEEVATTAMESAGYNMVAGMVNAMLSAESLASVRNAAVSLALSVNGAYTAEQDISSPSKVWAGFGRFMVLGMANSLYSNADLVEAASTELASSANTALEAVLNQISADGLDNGLQPVITPVLDLTDIQNGMGMMNSMLGSQTYTIPGIANISPMSMMDQSIAMLSDAINRISMNQSQPSYGDINVVVNAQGIDDPDLLADVVAQRIYTEILSREAVVF